MVSPGRRETNAAWRPRFGRPGRRWPRTVLMARVLAVGLGAAGLWWAWSWLAPGPVARGVAAYNRGDWNEASRLAEQRLAVAKDDRTAMRSRAGGGSPGSIPLRGRSTIASTRPTWKPRITACWAWPGTYPESPLRPRKSWARHGDPDHAESLYLLAMAAFQRGWALEGRRAAERLVERPGWEARAELLLGMIDPGDNNPTGSAERCGAPSSETRRSGWCRRTRPARRSRWPRAAPGRPMGRGPRCPGDHPEGGIGPRGPPGS